MKYCRYCTFCIDIENDCYYCTYFDKILKRIDKVVSCVEFVMSELGDVDTGKQYKPRIKRKNMVTQQISLFDTK